MQTNPAVEQSKIIRWPESPCNQSGTKGIYDIVNCCWSVQATETHSVLCYRR